MLRADFLTLTLPDSPFPALRSTRSVPGCSLGPARGVRPLGREEFATVLDHSARGSQRDSSRDRTVLSWFAEHQPRRLADAVLRAGGVDPRRRVADVRGKELDRLWRAVVHAELPVTGTDGFAKAEVTAGGVDLRQLERRTLESREHPGLRWCGEVLDATGRLGGFNFQWAYSSGYVAGGNL